MRALPADSAPSHASARSCACARAAAPAFDDVARGLYRSAAENETRQHIRVHGGRTPDRVYRHGAAESDDWSEKRDGGPVSHRGDLWAPAPPSVPSWVPVSHTPLLFCAGSLPEPGP